MDDGESKRKVEAKSKKDSSLRASRVRDVLLREAISCFETVVPKGGLLHSHTLTTAGVRNDGLGGRQTCFVTYDVIRKK